MSVSATTAAKRRRAGNIVSSPLFKPTSAPIENSVQRRTNMSQLPTPQPQTRPNPNINSNPQSVTHESISQRPMSLQQVISVFDKRLLHIESHMLNNTPLTSNHQSVSTSDVTKDMETLKTSIRENLDGQFSEFDHRYQVLATELSNIKQVVLKLQTYTLEINKSLMDERTTILSQLSEIQEKLKNGTSIDACTNTENSEETIQFAINDVSQELLEAQQDNLLEQEMETENKEEEVEREMETENNEEEVEQEMETDSKEEESTQKDKRRKKKNKNVVAISV